VRILGCWYTHFDPLTLDRDRALLECSLRSVEKMAAASENCEPVIATCVWKPLGSLNRFEEFVHWHRHESHLCIAQQILRILYEMQERGERFDYVALLEHDVMYPHDYFDRLAGVKRATYGGEDVTEVVDRLAFSDQPIKASTDLTDGDDPQPGVFKNLVIDYETEIGERSQTWDEGQTVAFPRTKPVGISHLDYIGLRATGWCEANQRDEPLHQMSCTWEMALWHFERVCRECIVKGSRLLEFNDLINCVIPYQGDAPSVHINHERTFTSHRNIYADEGRPSHPYWGEASDYWNDEWLKNE
jgi:hypothetical protein